MDEDKNYRKNKWQKLLKLHKNGCEDFCCIFMDYHQRTGLLVLISNYYQIIGIKFSKELEGYFQAEIVLNSHISSTYPKMTTNLIRHRKEKGDFYILDTLNKTVDIIKIIGEEKQFNSSQGDEGYEIIIEKKRMYQFDMFGEMVDKLKYFEDFRIDYENSILYLYKMKTYYYCQSIRYY